MNKAMRILAIAGMLIIAPVLLCAPFCGVAAAQSYYQADRIAAIDVSGNERIETSTILAYIDLKVGDNFDPVRMNEALKTLFATGLFADVSLNQQGKTLVIKVMENPVINQIAYEGNHHIEDDELSQETQLRPRMVYSRTKVQADVDRLYEIYRRNGRFSADIEPKIIQLDQNRINLVFEINEGPKTKVQRIRFIGNQHFSDADLKEAITTKEERWYRFLTTADVYDPDRLAFDREMLRRFYIERGYADFQVDSIIAELTPDRENFYVTITLHEGDRYRFGNVNIDSRIQHLDGTILIPAVTITPGDWYNALEVESTVDALTAELGNRQYAFVNIDPEITRDREKHRIDINFVIKPSPRVFVERIDIKGNVRTLDEVIRREMRLVEGDPFNASRLERSEQRLNNLGFFERVSVDVLPGSAPDLTVIEVSVTEQSTGELSIGAGFSTADGPLADLRIRERNLLGKGQELQLSTTIAGQRREFDLSFTEPYFLDRDLAAGFDLFHITREYQQESSFDQQQTGGALRIGYPLGQYLRQNLRYRIERNDISNVDPAASVFIQQQEGDRITSAVSQKLVYDRRDSTIEPKDGYVLRLENEIAGVGGDARYFMTKANAAFHTPLINDNWILTLFGEVGYNVGWGGQDVRINERFYIGGNTLRGFEDGGIGPRDLATNDSLGGNRFVRGTVELTFPLPVSKELGIKGHVFSDFGSLAGIDQSGATIADESSVRVTGGAGLSWRSPLGPIRIDVAKPLAKEDFDETEPLRLSFGTRF